MDTDWGALESTNGKAKHVGEGETIAGISLMQTAFLRLWFEASAQPVGINANT